LNRSRPRAGELSPWGGGDANDSGLSAVRGSGVDGRWGKEGGVAHVAVSKRERWKKKRGHGRGSRHLLKQRRGEAGEAWGQGSR
jgi:hypothetical protein